MIPPDPLDRALASLREGRADEAENALREALALEPANAEALHLLGVVRLKAGVPLEAVALLARAAELAPRHAMAWSNLGVAHAAAGDFASALSCHEKVLKLVPGHATALKNRAIALRRLGRFEEALASARRAVSVAPGDAEAWRAAGDVLVDLQRLVEALTHYDRALALLPGDVASLHNRGTAYFRQGWMPQAEADYRAAIALAPGFAKACDSLGLLLVDLGRPEEALPFSEQAVALEPDDADHLANCTLALDQLGRREEALCLAERAVELSPGNALAWTQLAVIRACLGHDTEARTAFERAAALDPRNAFTLVHRLHLNLKRCDWAGLDRLAARIRELAGAGASCPPHALLHVAATPALQYACAKSQAKKALTPRVWPARPAGARVHLAYLSADFHDHPVTQLLAPLLEHHDRNRFEVSLLSFGSTRPGAMRERLQAACDRFEDLGDETDHDIAERARRLRVDIAIDLMGFTDHARPGIFEERAAPIQAQYLGFPGTMGTPGMDYLFADATVIREDELAFYSEKIAFLPDTYQANDAARAIDTREFTRAELGLPEPGVVFCCFNDRLKIGPEVFDSWMRILAGVPGSVLWLVDGGEAASRNLRAAAAARGVAPGRLVFAPRMPLEVHLARLRAADLALDTFHYNGHATTSDTLLAGVPVIACLGESFAARVAASLLRANGLPELVVDSPKAYEGLAIRFARNFEALAALRTKCEANRRTQPLFDIARFTRHFEAACAAMWVRHCNGLAPDHLGLGDARA